MKRLLCSLLVICVLASSFFCLQVSSFASDRSGKCGDNVTYTFDSETSLLTISGTGEMYDDDYRITRTLTFRDAKHVVINEGVTSIGVLAFEGCEKLVSIDIAENVSVIKEAAFYGCTELKDVTISDNLNTIESQAFHGCSSLKEFQLPKNVENIGTFSFYGCDSLESIFIPSSATSIGQGAFSNCAKLDTITVDSNNPVFDSRDNSNAIIETKTNTLHTGCGNTVIPNSVTSIGSCAFYECADLTDLSLSTNVTKIEHSAFYRCKNLLKAMIPDSVKIIEFSAFGQCSNLTELTMPVSALIDGFSVFSQCSNIERISLTKGTGVMQDYNNLDIESDQHYTNTPWYISRNKISSITISDGVKNIGNFAFKGCNGLENIRIPDSVTSIGDYAFQSCTGLTNLTIPNDVTKIGESTFYGCTGLTSIILSKRLKTIENRTFYGCKALNEISIPDSVTDIGYQAFWDCPNLNRININSLSSWCNITFSNSFSGNHDLFLNDEKITDLSIPNDITSIGNMAFYACTGITSVTIPESVTSIGDCSFIRCTDLKDIVIPASVKSVGGSAFYNCTNLSTITIEDGLTSIGESAFSGTKIKNIIIPDSVVYIGRNAFSCGYLETIEISGDCDIFDSEYTIPKWTTIICGSKKAYDYAVKYNRNYICKHDSKNDKCIANIEPDCTQQGSKKYVCSICGIEYTEIIPELEHDYDTLVIEPNCTDVGYTIYTCSRCGDSYTDNETAPNGHHIPSTVVIENKQDATCTDSGSLEEVVYCTKCGIQISRIEKKIEALGHNYTVVVTPPTCIEAGYNKYSCACGESYIDTPTAPLGHTLFNTKVVNPTSVKAGYTDRKCLVCGTTSRVCTVPTGVVKNIKCKARTTNAETIYWSAINGAQGYQIQVSNVAGNAWDKVYNAKTKTSYTIKSLTAGGTYKFRVRIYAKGIDGKYYYGAWTKALNSPTLPSGTTVTKLTPAKKAFTAQWKKNATVNGYQIQYGLKSNFSGAKTLTVKNPKLLKASASKLYSGKYYYVRIRTYKTISKANYYSAWSKTYKVKTK